MAVDTIYTVAGGAWFQDSLNGVAAFFNSRAGDSLIAMATAVSVIVGAATYIRTRNIMDLVKWAGLYVLVIAVLYTLVNLSTDLVCAWLDPRLRLGEGRDR